MPRIRGSFDFFFATGCTPAAGAGARCAAGNDALFAGGGEVGFDGVCGTGALEAGVGTTGGDTGALGAGACGSCGRLDDVGKPVGPVIFGKTTVGADAAMVSSKSRAGLLTCPSGRAVD
jgi:hypothetical protein